MAEIKIMKTPMLSHHWPQTLGLDSSHLPFCIDQSMMDVPVIPLAKKLPLKESCLMKRISKSFGKLLFLMTTVFYFLIPTVSQFMYNL